MNHHRDSVASHIGHHDLMSYFSVAENESIGRIKFKLMEVWTKCFCVVACMCAHLSVHVLRIVTVCMYIYLQKMIQPCGPPPVKDDDEDDEDD